MMPRILAVRSALPDNHCRQAQFTDAFADRGNMGQSERVLMERLHAAAEVATRYTVLPLAECGVLQGAEAVNDRYIDEATTLGERALRRALDAAGISPADLDLLIVTSVTGVAVPSIDARLIPRLGLRPDIRRLPIFGLGCVAGAAALGRLHDYLLGWPGQTAALLAVELCSLNWPTIGVTPADMVAAGLFGDGRWRSSPAAPRPRAAVGAAVPATRRRVPRSSPPAARSTRTAVTRSAGGWAPTASVSC